jgi:hypothetical protein
MSSSKDYEKAAKERARILADAIRANPDVLVSKTGAVYRSPQTYLRLLQK